jgi:hypothetical protein
LRDRRSGVSVQGADAPRLRDTQEEADVGLAEAIDRLHRVAHGEQRAAVAGAFVTAPAGGKAFQQFNLGRAGVLEFVDQQVADAVVEAQAELAGVHLVAQRGDGARREFAEIDFAAFAEHQPQFGGGQLHQPRQRAHHGIVGVVGVPAAWRRRCPGRPRPAVIEAGQLGQHRVLLRLEFLARGKTVLHIDRSCAPCPAWVSRKSASARQRGSSSASRPAARPVLQCSTSPPRLRRGKARQRHPAAPARPPRAAGRRFPAPQPASRAGHR